MNGNLERDLGKHVTKVANKARWHFLMPKGITLFYLYLHCMPTVCTAKFAVQKPTTTLGFKDTKKKTSTMVFWATSQIALVGS